VESAAGASGLEGVATPERIAANVDVDGFALTADEMAAIDALGS
jgi:diketogulonate reductase-like aldo/keto reductase